MKLTALACALVAMAGCVEDGYKAAFEEIPPCPGGGYVYFEYETYEYNDQNVSRAYREHGWSNISIRYEGAGGFGDPKTVRLMSAECPSAVEADKEANL